MQFIDDREPQIMFCSLAVIYNGQILMKLCNAMKIGTTNAFRGLLKPSKYIKRSVARVV